MTRLPRRQILLGDALEHLRELPSASVDTCITSPPYYRLRDYGIAGQLGLEDHVDLWVERLRAVLAEVGRVLKPTGSMWLNLGDSFSRHPSHGAPPKGLLLAPERLLLALAQHGWLTRNKLIWSKPNPMPASVEDRLNLTYEVVYLLVRQGRYYFDLDAIREPHRSTRGRRATAPTTDESWRGPLAGKQDGLRRARAHGRPGHLLGKNPGDVWVIPTRGYKGAHFATFPEQLIERPLLATCPEAVCTRCRQPWRRRYEVHHVGAVRPAGPDKKVRRYPQRWSTLYEPGPLVACDCDAPTVPGIALDPFFGTGTVGVVAERLGRDWLGIEINPEYAKLAESRLEGQRQLSDAA